MARPKRIIEEVKQEDTFLEKLVSGFKVGKWYKLNTEVILYGGPNESLFRWSIERFNILKIDPKGRIAFSYVDGTRDFIPFDKLENISLLEFIED